MVGKIKRVGLDAQGKVMEKLEDAVVVVETVWDEKGRLLRETVYRAKGKADSPIHNKPPWVV
jgi:ribosomal protein L22